MTAAKYGDATALVFGEQRLSFASIEHDANRLARALQQAGVMEGRYVALGVPNTPDIVKLTIACWKIGAPPFPLNHRMPDREWDKLIELGNPALTIGERGTSVDELFRSAEQMSDEPLPDVATFPYKVIASGGSTGQPKLIIDNAPMGQLVTMVLQGFAQRPGTSQLIAGPLYFNGPFFWGMTHLVAGGTMVLMEHFDAKTYLDLLEKERISWSFVVPTMLHRIVRLPKEELRGREFPALETLLVSAAPFPQWLWRETIKIFGPEPVMELYGATEAGAWTTIRGTQWLEHPGSVGKFPGSVVVKILDENGTELPRGEIGEIWIRPPMRTISYQGAELKERPGGLRNFGDMGYLDDGGYLYLADRRADLIISGGANIYPAEVEGVLLEHPEVLDAAVVGLADPEWGQRVHAILQVAKGAEVTEADLELRCRDALAAYKIPRSWEFVDALPRDPSGKLRRSALRESRDSAATARA